MANRKPQFDPNSPKARKLAAENARRREQEAAGGAQVSTATMTEWTARGGMAARDYPNVGRVTLSRQRMYGTRKYLFSAQLRPHDADMFAWQRLELPADVRRDQNKAMAWLDQWAADKGAAA